MIRSRSRAAVRLAVAGAATAALAATAAPALAKSTNLPAASGKVTRCHTTLFKVAGQLPVTTEIEAQKGAHPSRSLLGCANGNAVARAGKRYYSKYPFGLGKRVRVGKVTYTMGRTDGPGPGGLALSGPMYGWAGGGVVIYLINPSGA